MKKFDLSVWLKDKSRKVVTRDGRVVRIICCDAKRSTPIIALLPTTDGEEHVFSYNEKGRIAIDEPLLDLFFADEEGKTIDDTEMNSLAYLTELGYTCIPPKKEEDLEEAAKHCLYAILYDDVYVGNPTEEDCIRCFKAGAEWQKKKDQETIELAEEHAMLAGMEKMREEIMKDAVELTITNTSFIPLPKLDIKAGDKAKIIIIKTEQQ